MQSSNSQSVHGGVDGSLAKLSPNDNYSQYKDCRLQTAA